MYLATDEIFIQTRFPLRKRERERESMYMYVYGGTNSQRHVDVTTGGSVDFACIRVQ